MDKKIAVTIIVPVYNAEKCLNRCVDSILRQTCQELEVLLIDDGSQDRSGEICDQYAKSDERVRVIHKENSGVSDSRNLAMQLARGEYLQFVDSDDWIVPEATELFLREARANDCDMVISDFYRVVGERVSHKGDIQESGVLTREEFAACMMEKPADFYYGVLWNKLYRRDLIMENGLKMDSEISWCEDFMFNLEYIRYTKKIGVVRIPTYYYVKTKGSLVSQSYSLSRTIKMKRSVFEHYNEFYKAVFDEEDYEKSRLQVYRFLIDAAGDGIVPPVMIPRTYHLGEERVTVSQDLMESEDILTDLYIRRKLLDKCLQPVAVKNDLQLEDVYVLLYLRKDPAGKIKDDMSDFLDLSKSKITLSLLKLTNKGLIKKKDGAEEANGEIQLLEKAEDILEDLHYAEEEYQRLWAEGKDAVRLFLAD